MEKSKKKILAVCYEYPPLGGGGADFVRDLFTNISQRHEQIEIDLIAYGNNKIIEKEPEAPKRINIYRVGNSVPRKNRATSSLIGLVVYPIFAIPKGLSLGRKNNYDEVYSIFVLPSGFAGIILAKLLRKPHYLTVIAGDIYKPTKSYSAHKVFIFRWAVEFIVKNSVKVNTISHDVKEKLYKFFNIGREIPVEVNNLGVPLRSIPDNSNLPKFKKFTFTALARLDSRKGYDILIKAYARLKNAQDTQLIIMGDGPEEEYLKSVAKNEGVEERVKFLGYVSGEDKYKNLAKSHCFVLASYHEGFGLVYVESLYNGVPILSTSCGGVSDIVTEGENGLLSPVGDIEALSKNMQKVLDQPELLKKLSANAKESVQKFDISKIADEYVQFLE